MTVEKLTPITDKDLIEKVKAAISMKGTTYHDDTISVWIDFVKNDLLSAGVSADVLGSTLAVGCISQGVDDIWVSKLGAFSDFYNRSADVLRNVVVKGAE